MIDVYRLDTIAVHQAGNFHSKLKPYGDSTPLVPPSKGGSLGLSLAGNVSASPCGGRLGGGRIAVA
jgi:hypothetical protein